MKSPRLVYLLERYGGLSLGDALERIEALELFVHEICQNGGWLETLTEASNKHGETWCGYCGGPMASQQTHHKSDCKVRELMDRAALIVSENWGGKR